MDVMFEEAYSAIFPSSRLQEPFHDDKDYIRDAFSFLAFALVGAASFKKLVAEQGLSLNLPGTAMSTEEALAYLSDYRDYEAQPDDAIAEAAARSWESMERRLALTRELGISLRLDNLRSLFQLGDFSYFCLISAYACETDRGFEQLFSALNGRAGQFGAALDTIRAIYEFVFPEREGNGGSCDPFSDECRYIFSLNDSHDKSLPLTLRPHVTAYLQGLRYRNPALWSCARLLDGSGAEGAVVFCPHQVETAERVLAYMRSEEWPIALLLCGAKGSGRKMTLELFAAKHREAFLCVDLHTLMDDGWPEDAARELVLSALLDNYIPTLEMNADFPDGQILRLLSLLAPFGVGAVVLTSEARNTPVTESHLVVSVDYPDPEINRSPDIWRFFSAGYNVSPDLNWEQLAAKYVLTPGQIAIALRTADMQARLRETTIDEAVIGRSVLMGNTGRLGEIAQRIEAVYTWEDLVLGEASLRLLRDACDRVRFRYLVEQVWGFGGKTAYGKGVSILFYGPPGTGKTMSAQVVASDLGLPLYRIDLAQIISKYIGETAKNLDRVFREAKSSNVILFFDEADSLFAKRTEVKNSNDRHANSESAYLLQKIEEYSGVSILATNLASNFDEAFRRRINYTINIHMPNADQRLRLWRISFPADAPLEKDVDFAALAENLEISGSVIKSAARKAAYFAAGSGESIGMRHIARAARLELNALGKPEPHFLAAYTK